MLSAFPYLLSWNQLSPFLIRLVLAGVLIYWSTLRFRKQPKTNKDWVYMIIDAVLGVLLLLGLWTQVAALIVGLDLIYRVIEKVRAKAFLTQGVNYYLILLVLCISLMLTGAGLFAFDIAI